jgi:hypothetical protein
MQRASGTSATVTQRAIGQLIQNIKIRQLNFTTDRSGKKPL